MSVLIKNMTMPECCAMCPMCHRNFDRNETRLACYALSAWCIEDEDRLEKCPLVELPEKHGRLVEFIDVATETDEDTGLEEVNLGEAFAAYFKMRESKPVIEAEGEG